MSALDLGYFQEKRKDLIEACPLSAGGLRRRLLGCAAACSVDGDAFGSTAAAAGASATVSMLLLSHRLRADPVDRISVYVTLDAPDPVLGKLLGSIVEINLLIRDYGAPGHDLGSHRPGRTHTPCEVNIQARQCRLLAVQAMANA
jgi:hypothetical protein